MISVKLAYKRWFLHTAISESSGVTQVHKQRRQGLRQ
jgi:hypothetical protein